MTTETAARAGRQALVTFVTACLAGSLLFLAAPWAHAEQVASPAHSFDQRAFSPGGAVRTSALRSRASLRLAGVTLNNATEMSHGYDATHLLRVSPRAVATNTPAPIGFAPGEGVSALTAGRLQHGTRHLTEAGVLPAWSGKSSPQLIRDTLSPILENPTATFNNTLGGTKVRGFIGSVNGQTVAVQVYAEGPMAGQLATAVVPTPNQLTKWGVGP